MTSIFEFTTKKHQCSVYSDSDIQVTVRDLLNNKEHWLKFTKSSKLWSKMYNFKTPFTVVASFSEHTNDRVKFLINSKLELQYPEYFI